MKRMKKKLISVLLGVLLILSAAVPVCAEQTPVTKEQTAEAITKADKAVSGLLSSGAVDFDAEQMLYGMLISDETLNGIFTSLYSAFSENADTFRLIGADISVENVAACLANYPEVRQYLLEKGSWESVFASPLNCRWNLSAKEDFGFALADMLRPFNELLFVLLCSGKAGGIISVQGADGYQNAVVPLLEAAGCPAVMTQADYTAAAAADRTAMVKNAVSMLFAAIDNILAKPVENTCRYLPCIADYLSGGGIAESAKALISPIVIKIGIIPLSGLDRLIERSGVFSDPEGLSSMFEGMDPGALAGDGLNLPQMDLKKLAACTVKTESGYETDEEAAFGVIVDFIIEAIKLNADGIPGMPEEAADILKSFENKSTEEIRNGIVRLLTFKPEDAVQDYQWQFPAYTPGTVTYPAGMTRENFQRVLEQIDSTLSEFLVEFAGQQELSKMISGMIYSPDTLTALTTGIYSALGNEEMQGLLSLIGADFSVYAVSDALQGVSPSAAYSLRQAGSWEYADSIDWDITPGKRKGFEKCLNAVLSPLSPVLEVLLSEGSLRLFDAIDIYGSDGYNTAVIPVLEALGCEAPSIKMYTEYKALSSAGRIKAITKPVFDLLDKIVDTPIATLCGLLPNLLYFIDGGCMETVIQNLLYPVTSLLENAGLSDMLPKELTEMKLDPEELISGLTSSADLGFELPKIDFKAIEGLGTASVLTSKATFSGSPATYTYITADAPAVLATVVRYAFDAMGGTDMFSGMMGNMGSAGADAGMMSMYTDTFTSQLEGKSTDELIKWFYDLLFKESPKREEEPENDFIPTVIYQPKKDYTETVIIVCAAVIVAAVTGVIIFVSKHDFKKDKPKKKKEKKENKPGKQKKEVNV